MCNINEKNSTMNARPAQSSPTLSQLRPNESYFQKLKALITTSNDF